MKQAFANTPMPNDKYVFCSYPAGYERKGYVLRWGRHGHGLHEPPVAFNRLLLEWMVKHRFSKLKRFKQSKVVEDLVRNEGMYVGLYVDGIVYTGPAVTIEGFL